jgi:glucuronoarabinoxylan endo-1,4-beta-xylanase
VIVAEDGTGAFRTGLKRDANEWDMKLQWNLVPPILCLGLAWCGLNGLGAKSDLLGNSNSVGVATLIQDSQATSCSVTPGSCPQHPEVANRITNDDYKESASNDRACMQRPSNFIAWCTTSDPMNATFFQNGQATDTKTGSLNAPPPTPSPSPSPTPSPSAGDIVIDAATQFQTIVGFGASDAGDLSPQQMDLFFSEDNGIGLSLLRAIITPSGGVFGGSWANKRGAIARGAKIFATPLSPPAAFKDNGDVNNGGILVPQYYGNWADALVSFVDTAAQHGVPIYAMSMQNEPEMSMDYYSCTYTPEQMASFIEVAGPKLAALSPRPLLIMPENSVWETLWSYTATLEADPAASRYVDIYATHQYSDPTTPQSNAKPIWETEYSTFDPFDPTISNGIKVAQAIYSAIVIGNASAWNYWMLLGSSPANAVENNEGLIGQKADGPANATMTKRFYTLGNFSKFVRPDYVRVATTASSDPGVSVVAFKNPSNGMPIVIAINANSSDASVGFSLRGTAPSRVITPWVTSSSLDLSPQAQIAVSGDHFATTLPAQSVTTFVGSP